MKKEEQDAVRKLIADELARRPESVTAPQSPLELPGAPQIKDETPLPSEVPLTEYEALMANALSWRIESAEKTDVLLKKEKLDISKMRDSLIQRCVERLKINTNDYLLRIDVGTGTIKIEKRG